MDASNASPEGKILAIDRASWNKRNTIEKKNIRKVKTSQALQHKDKVFIHVYSDKIVKNFQSSEIFLSLGLGEPIETI